MPTTVTPLTADMTTYTADTTALTADMTQLVVVTDDATGIVRWPPLPKRKWRKGRENDEAILIHLMH